MSAELIDLPYLTDPSHWLEQLSDLPYPILLDSCNYPAEQARYHIITAAPRQWLTLQGTELQLHDGQSHHAMAVSDPRQVWQAIEALRPAARDDQLLPFAGGLAGFLGYEFGQWQVIGQPPTGTLAFPDVYVGNYRWALVQDRQLSRTHLVIQADCEIGLARRLKALSSIENHASKSIKYNGLSANIKEIYYKDAFHQIQRYIQAGDCYQINFTQRFSGAYDDDLPALYRSLRARQSGAQSAYIGIAQDKALISLSPERLVACDSTGKVLAQPIKGTLPRHPDPTTDKRNAESLLRSRKDQAENLMIVDLLRNDLSRVCIPGSVKVPSLFTLQSLENVHHLVSSIVGQLGPDQSALALFEACFPGGSVTGAPKRRAMEIIHELEQQGRSAYCGSVFYLSDGGNFDANITIRSLVATVGQLYCWGGGGITADSQADAEYQESISKISRLLRPG